MQHSRCTTEAQANNRTQAATQPVKRAGLSPERLFFYMHCSEKFAYDRISKGSWVANRRLTFGTSYYPGVEAR